MPDRSVLIVRHAMPELRPDSPPEQWTLGAAGRCAARQLAAALPADSYVVTSEESKARQTAEQLVAVRGGVLVGDERVGEVRRPDDWIPDHRTMARAYVEGAVHEGWEPAPAVAERFDEAVRSHAEQAGERPLIVVNHGMALVSWLASRMHLADPGEFWASLAFPDAVEADLGAGAVRRLT
jgi:broad specificity phosphatase PhoE